MEQSALMRKACKSFSDLVTRRLVGYAPDEILGQIKAANYIAQDADLSLGAWNQVTRRFPDGQWHQAFKATTEVMTGFWGRDMPTDILDGIDSVNGALAAWELERAARARDYVPHLLSSKSTRSMVSYNSELLILATQRLIGGLTALRDEGMLPKVSLKSVKTYLIEGWNEFAEGAEPPAYIERPAKAALRAVIEDLIHEAGGVTAENVLEVAEKISARVEDLLPSSTTPNSEDGFEAQDIREGEAVIHVLRNGALELYSIDPDDYTLLPIATAQVPALAHFHIPSDEPIYIIDGRMSGDTITTALYDSQIEMMREFGSSDKDRTAQTAKTWQETGLAFLDCGQVFTRPVVGDDGTVILVAIGDTVPLDEADEWEPGELEENGMSLQEDGYSYPECVGFEWHRIGTESSWIRLLKERAGLDEEQGRALLQATVSGSFPKGFVLDGCEGGRHVYLAYGASVDEFRSAATMADVPAPHHGSELGAIISVDPISFGPAMVIELGEFKQEPLIEPGI